MCFGEGTAAERAGGTLVSSMHSETSGAKQPESVPTSLAASRHPAKISPAEPEG